MPEFIRFLLMRTGLSFDFQNYVAERKSLIEDRLGKYLSYDDPHELWESIRYSVLSGGKRLRALLCMAAAEAVAFGQKDERRLELRLERARELVLPCACSIEMLHAMSLIHDDLPCMDDDDMRRGRPTNHKVFGEAMALLAGDALLLLANETLLKESSEEVDLRRLVEVASSFNKAAGAAGMVGGQVADILSTGKGENSANQQNDASLLRRIHARKTGALLKFSVWSGACLAGADEKMLELFERYGEILGLSFQVKDDLLDVTGNIESLGKTPGKDLAAGKLTWISVYGIEQSRLQLSAWEIEGREALDKLGLADDAVKPLLALLEFAIHRKN